MNRIEIISVPNLSQDSPEPDDKRYSFSIHKQGPSTCSRDESSMFLPRRRFSFTRGSSPPLFPSRRGRRRFDLASLLLPACRFAQKVTILAHKMTIPPPTTTKLKPSRYA